MKSQFPRATDGRVSVQAGSLVAAKQLHVHPSKPQLGPALTRYSFMHFKNSRFNVFGAVQARVKSQSESKKCHPGKVL